MRWKTMLMTIVLNIFLMLSATILFEYVDLSERFISIEDTVQEALDSAIESSVGSEELFSAEYQAKLSSFGITTSKASTEVRTLLWVDSEKKFYKVNTYLLAYFYNVNGRLPQNSGDINVLNSYGRSGTLNGQTGFIYEWLYGEQKTDYLNSALTWANRSPSRRSEYNSIGNGGRTGSANSSFREFYNSVGKYQQTAGYLKQRVGTISSFTLTPLVYPTLMNMGYSWMSNGTVDYTRTGSNVTHDNFTSTFHVGKAINGQAHTIYYLTPASLGVTYIPVEVLKPAFVVNLDTVARLNYIGGASTSGHVGENAADASHCVETSVYDGGSHKTHTPSTSSEDIVTDGLVEFDLSTAKVKVDYFYVDFNSPSLARSNRETIIAKVNGAVQSYNANGTAQLTETASKSKTLDAFLSSSNDTLTLVNTFGNQSIVDKYNTVRHGRIVARVSVKVKVHVPYKSSMLQWMCENFRTGTNHHYDIKLWDETGKKANTSSDGIWYQYTTYYCTSRS